MPISQFLGNSKFDPETKRIMGLAFEMTRLALGVPDRGDIANELIAKRIIELAKAGERNPDLLCESAVKDDGADVTFVVAIYDTTLSKYEILFELG